MNRFEGKFTLVTGAGSGIGQASAIRLAREGAAVACVDIDVEAVKGTAEGIVGGTVLGGVIGALVGYAQDQKARADQAAAGTGQ